MKIVTRINGRLNKDKGLSSPKMREKLVVFIKDSGRLVIDDTVQPEVAPSELAPTEVVNSKLTYIVLKFSQL